MKDFTYFLLISLLTISFSSCNEKELEAPVPAYLHINDMMVQNPPPLSDTASDKITDAWVYVNNQSIGSFELPAIIPIQKIGKVSIKIRGGIFRDGMSNSRATYPFYDFFTLDTVLHAEEHFYLHPLVQYFPKTIFDNPWSGEDFESGINFETNPKSDTVFVRETDKSKVFKGNASGAAYLNESMDFFEAYTPTFSSIPRGTSPIYLEMNYKCTHDVVISIYANNRKVQLPVLNLRPKASWNKVYVNLGSVFSTLAQMSNFNLAIGYQKPLGEKGALYIDNVKLLHF